MFNGWTIRTVTGIANALPASTSYSTLASYYDTNTETASAISTTTTISNLVTTPNGEVTLIAKWKAVTY